METYMLYGHFDDLNEFAEWVNDLVGDDLLKAVIRRVIHFQLLPVQSGGLDAAILVELAADDRLANVVLR